MSNCFCCGCDEHEHGGGLDGDECTGCGELCDFEPEDTEDDDFGASMDDFDNE